MKYRFKYEKGWPGSNLEPFNKYLCKIKFKRAPPVYFKLLYLDKIEGKYHFFLDILGNKIKTDNTNNKVVILKLSAEQIKRVRKIK